MGIIMLKNENWILPECKVDGYVPVAFFCAKTDDKCSYKEINNK